MTVALCTRNGAALIGEQLDALVSQQLDEQWEILIVDNDSDDATPAIAAAAAAEHDRVRVVRATEHHNLAYARNVAARSSSGEYLAFVDDDDVVGDGWLRGVATSVASADLVGYRFEYERLNEPDLLVGRSRFQSVELGSVCGRPVVAGACAVNRSLWERLGGNDERWSFSGEDFDFSLRAAAAGAAPMLSSNAFYHVRLRSGVRPAFGQARRAGRAHVALAHRHCGQSTAPSAVASWWWLLSRLPLAAVGTRRDLWARRFGDRVGRLEQALRHQRGDFVVAPTDAPAQQVNRV